MVSMADFSKSGAFSSAWPYCELSWIHSCSLSFSWPRTREIWFHSQCLHARISATRTISTATIAVLQYSCETCRVYRSMRHARIYIINKLYLTASMRDQKYRKNNAHSLKFPQIKDKLNPISAMPVSKGIKLEKIGGQKKNLMLMDIVKINKIEKEFTIMTKRMNKKQEEPTSPKKDEMRESRLLLLKDKAPPALSRSTNQNLLSNLVLYNPSEQPTGSKRSRKMINIPQSNITGISPTKPRQVDRQKQRQSTTTAETQNLPQYNREYIQQFQKLDFVKMFIVEQLLYFISKSTTRNKQQMAGFCKFYNENTAQQCETEIIIASVLNKENEYLQSIFYEKLGFYIFLILGTDTELHEEASFPLRSLMGYLHTNNLIILDIVMEIVDMEKLPIASQFHVYNTSRFNQSRRKINTKADKMSLVARNNRSAVQIIKSILTSCGFDSLKTFVNEIIANNQVEYIDKIKQVSMMLISLDSILVSSLHLQNNESNKPKPPFLKQKQKETPYTLVLDMDETLIHYYENANRNGSLLVRPYCHEFLQEMSQHYEIVIFTAAVKDYADQILDTIDRKNCISHRLYREHTRLEDYVSIKDLSLINRDLSKTIIVDNIASNFKLQPRNGVAISTWTGDPEDVSLLNLIPVLVKLAKDGVKDVRDGLELLSDYMEARMKANEPIDFDKVSLKGC